MDQARQTLASQIPVIRNESMRNLMAEVDMDVDSTGVDEEVVAELSRLVGEDNVSHLSRMNKLSKEQSRRLDILSRKLWLKNHTKRAKSDPQDEQARRHALANQQLRMQALSSIPESHLEIFRKLGEEPIYQSSNTIGWLEDKEHAALIKRDQERVKDVWAMVFRLPDEAQEMVKHNEQLASTDGGMDSILHINTESDSDFEDRSVQLRNIPDEHIVLTEGKAPTLSEVLIVRLEKFGDIDAITVRVRQQTGNAVEDLREYSWAFVTYELETHAAELVNAGVWVPGEDHTGTGHHMVPERSLQVVKADFQTHTSAIVKQHVSRHFSSEASYRAMPITHECWAFCHRCLASDIDISHHMTGDGKHIIVCLAATVDCLVQEAKRGGTVMRLAETKGTMFFHQDLIHFFAANHGGLNECTLEDNHTKWLPREPRLATEWSYRPPLDAEGKMPWEFPGDRSHKVFTSAHAQMLVMRRLKSHARIDPSMQKHAPDPRAAMKRVKHRVARSKKQKVTAEMCHDLLLSHGGFRPHNRDVFPKVQGKAVVALLAEACHKDPIWTLFPDGEVHTNVLAANDKAMPSYNLIIDVCRVLEAWTETVGREEQFVGSLRDSFPAHDEDELAYLSRDWARFGILFYSRLVGFEPERDLQYTVVAGEVQTKNQFFENNTFGSEANTPRVYTWPGLLFYQPLEEIHDYFGDDVGLYFAWLDKYTRALFLMSFYGTFVMAKQLMYHNGPDENPLTLIYSIYVGAWSILFLQAWNRREEELRFLWGLDQREHEDQTRRAFKHGPNVALEINPDTGRQTYVVGNMAKQLTRKLISGICVVCLMLCAVALSTLAILVRYMGEEQINKAQDRFTSHGSDSDGLPDSDHNVHYKYNMSSELVSAFLGLFTIIVCGMIFDGVATKLNDYENHRTEDDYDDGLILKTFAFQFLNNYWALIYIAYFREIPDPIFGEIHPCEEGSCMFELQFQLIVVFSFKTVGKQIGFTLRPFIFKAVKLVLANRQLKQALNSVGDISKSTIKKIPGGDVVVAKTEELTTVAANFGENVVDAAVGQNIAERQHAVGLNRFEVQDSLMKYKGTFNDFNDRTVQFGYIVLFAPAFPLAPLLAFVNNIVEIRAAGFKLCHGYRRPVVKRRSGLGTWAIVLNSLGFMAVIMNSTMINFVGRQNARGFGVPDTPGFWEDESTTMYNKDLAGGFGLRLENNSGLLGRTNVAALWLRFFIVEHCSMAVRLLVFFLTPDVPVWIKTAKETLDFREKTHYQTYDALEQQKRYREKYEQKLNSHMEGIREHLEQILNTQSLATIFEQLDVDGSGFMSAEELGVFFEMLGVDLTPTECDQALKEMDTDPDGEPLITLEMIIEWLQKLDLIGENVDYGQLRSPTHRQLDGLLGPSEDEENDPAEEANGGNGTDQKAGENGSSETLDSVGSEAI